MTIQEQIHAFFPQLVQIRREFHQHPELGTQEFWTGRQICHYLDLWGIPYEYPIADTGVMAVLTGKKKGGGPVVGYRADIDALPLTEDASRSYCSLNPGVMHACGHDAHTAIALGTAKILKDNESSWSGCLKIFFQPAEETIGGAKRMVEAGCMENPKVDYVTGLHVMPTYPAGEIEYRYGKLNAATDEIHITVEGKGCHGAYPETGTDAIVIAASLISALQSLVSRNISPLNNAVLTLGTIQGGTACNIVAETVEITGSLRTLDPQTRQLCYEVIQRQTEGICQAFGGKGRVEITPGYDALINTDFMVDLLVDTACSVVGQDHVHPKEFPSLGAEDFSFFLDKAPGVFYHLGCADPSRFPAPPLHNSGFDIDESCLELGVRMQTELILRLLSRSV